jgi:ESCRT-I complex subunit VPS28
LPDYRRLFKADKDENHLIRKKKRKRCLIGGNMTERKTTTAETKPRIKLYENARDRRAIDQLADLYAIFKATEHLEVSYARDAISKEAYTDACSELITQFKTVEPTLKQTPHANATAFLEYYNATTECTRAMRRLLQDGVPATVVHQDHSVSNNSQAVVVAETVSNFITVIDSLKLNIMAVDELTMLMVTLMGNLNRTVGVPDDFAPKLKVHQWVKLLQSMAATAEITEDQARQLELDMNTSYSHYFQSLGK